VTAPAIPVSGEWVTNGFDVPANHVREDQQPRAPVVRERPRMSIVLPFIEREVPQVLRLLDWMVELSGQLKRTVYLLPFKGLVANKKIYDQIFGAAERAFSDVQVIADNEGVTSDWKVDAKIRDAAGPNSLFRQAAWFFHFKPMLGPWLYLEPDCVPLKPTWADDLEAAYVTSATAGKPFFGAGMRSQTGEAYLNGAAIYPQNAVTLAASLVTRTMWKEYPEMETSFDMAGGKEVLRKSQITDLIQLDYRSADPKPKPGALLFHGDKDGKLINSGSKTRNNGCRTSAIRPDITTRASAQKVSKRKAVKINVAPNGDVSLHDIESAVGPVTTIGDQIRLHVRALSDLATNSNRKVRILAELRKTTLLPRIAR
jgi:hypothetical protein